MSSTLEAGTTQANPSSRTPEANGAAQAAENQPVDRAGGDLEAARAKRGGILSIKMKQNRESRRQSRRQSRQGYIGAPPNCPIGTMFESRIECSRAGVHFPTVAGISGSTDTSKKDGQLGAYSIVLNGGYEDDVDNGYTIHYTGAGGQVDSYADGGSQVGDQSIKYHFNHALRLSLEYGNPVRVVRGFKNKSSWGPSQGYRYDGLYKVTKYGMTTGKSGFKICRFKLERLPDQKPLEKLPKDLK